ncbi:MAG: sterol transfer family, partial [Thermoleophilaceae bacterium]|nr:sterol transfer family [Thermoleophilaceae bacterium]
MADRTKSRSPRRQSGRAEGARSGGAATALAMDRMAAEDPELAARLFVQMLPAMVQRLSGPLAYDLEIAGLGTWHVAVDGNGGGARVQKGSNGHVDFTIASDAAGIAALAARESPLRLMASGKLQIKGKRRLALKLRALAGGPEPTIAAALAAGGELDADA